MKRAAAAGLLALALGFAGQIMAATTERIVGDPQAGTALYGYDAVAYFIEGTAHLGVAEHEARFEGLVWRFRSAANLAAFKHSPKAFVPEFGGYDAVAMAGNIPLAGNPALFELYDGKLFLFAREQNRARFRSELKAILEAASAAWPNVSRTLVP